MSHLEQHFGDSGLALFTGCLSEPEFPIRLHASVSMPSPPKPLLIFLTFYIGTFPVDLFAPVPTPPSSKFHCISARRKVIVLSLTLVFLSGTHCHCTLELLQLIDTFKPALKTYLFNLKESD